MEYRNLISDGMANCEISGVITGFYYLHVESKQDIQNFYRHAIMITSELK